MKPTYVQVGRQLATLHENVGATRITKIFVVIDKDIRPATQEINQSAPVDVRINMRYL